MWNNFFFLSLITEACENISVLRTVLFIKSLLKIAFILIPIGLIIMLSIDLAKNVISNKEDEMRKNVQLAIKRLVFIIFLFLVPTIVKYAINSLGNFNSDYETCYKVTAESIANQIEKNKTKCIEDGYEWNESTSECAIKSVAPKINISMSNGKKIKINSNTTNDDDSEEETEDDSDNAVLSTDFILPLKGSSIKINSGYGDRHKDSIGTKFHNALDLKASEKDPIYAVASGTVYVSGYNKARGNVIIIKHNKKLYTVYQHCRTNLVKQGEKVSKGQKIAEAGKTGKVTGPHLHFEVHTTISNQSTSFSGDTYNPCSYKSYKCIGGVNNGHSVTGTLKLK